MVTTDVIWNHRGRCNKAEEGPLELRVTIDRKAYYINTGIKCRKQDWKYGRIVNRYDSPELNERLYIITRALDAEVTRCVDAHIPIDVTAMKKKAWDMSGCEAPESFLSWCEDQLPDLKVKSGTLKHYKTTLTRMRECAIIVKWSDLTVEKVLEFDKWLHTLKAPMTDAEKKMGMRPRTLGDAAIYSYHKNLMGLIRRAMKLGRVEWSPYERLKGEFKRGVNENVEYLTEEEVAAFVNLHPIPGTMQAVSRDLFVFQLYTGLSYSDAQAFDIRNYKHVNGKWLSNGSRIKTGVPYVSQLLPPAVEVLERYNWKVPKIGNGEYNQCLKSLGTAAGIQTRLHSHLARHTFATMMLRAGAKIENVSRMLGHAKITQTMVYAKVLAQSVHEDFDKLAATLK